MKMKVKTEKLKAAIQKYVAQDKKRFERETEKYKIDLERANKRYVENVAAYLQSLRQGTDRHERYQLADFFETGCKFPHEPKEAETHTDLLIKLDLAEDQILTVDDHSDYMKFLSGKCICR